LIALCLPLPNQHFNEFDYSAYFSSILLNDYDDDELNDHDRILPLLLPLSQFHHHHHENDRVSNWHGAYAYHDCVYCDHVAVYRCDHGNGYAWYGYECDRDVR